MSQNPSLRLGTRGSKLAMIQSEMVAKALKARCGAVCEIVVVKTTGDRILDRPLADAGGKGLFVKELEEALLDGRIDFAVHSMKDVPALLPEGLAIGAVFPREDPADVLLTKKGLALGELPKGARVGTSSVRRKAQLLRARPDVAVTMLRGNVDTRLRKLEDGEADAVILAKAGLNRMGLADRPLTPLDWLPSLAQGVVGMELRADDGPTRDLIARLDHAQTAVALECERAFQAALDGSCKTPIAGLARIEGSVLSFHGEVLAPDGSDFVATEFELRLGGDPHGEAVRAGRQAGEALRPKAARWLQL